MLELEGGCLARHLKCKLGHASQPPHSLSQPQAPAHPGPAHPLLGPRNSWLHIRLLLSFLQVRAQPRGRRGRCTDDSDLQLHACSAASRALGLRGQKVTSAIRRLWGTSGNNETVEEDGECYQHSWQECKVHRGWD